MSKIKYAVHSYTYIFHNPPLADMLSKLDSKRTFILKPSSWNGGRNRSWPLLLHLLIKPCLNKSTTCNPNTE